MVINEVNSYLKELSIREKEFSRVSKSEKNSDKDADIKKTDNNRIAELKSAIESGNYKFDSVEVAKKILGY